MGIQAEPLRVLIVEDDEDDFVITRDLLTAQDRATFRIDWCPDYAGALTAIREQRHDLYLVDYRLGERTGLDLVREGFALRPVAPVILLTGRSDYEIDLEATALGVTDFLVKQGLDPFSLERSIRYAVSRHRSLCDLARSEERYAVAVRAASDGIWDWNLTSDRIYLSPRWHAILGQPERAGDHPPATWFDLVHDDDLARLRSAIAAHLAGETAHLESEHRIRHADGSWRWVLIRGLAIRDDAQRATRLAGSLSDITDRRRAELQLRHDALHDGLTGLPNRALFMERVAQALRSASRDGGPGCSVLFVDLDRFKLVNDSLNHTVGDRVLTAVAARLTGVLRPVDTVARIGGDEFTILLDGTGSEAGARSVAVRIHHALATVFEIDGHELFVTASIGIALNAPRLAPTELLRNADIAMYHAKRRGRGRCVAFDASMHRRVVGRLARENELRQAVEQSLITVHYQPIVDIATGRVQSVEALARWPVGWPELSPLEFIAIAEDTGAIAPLGLGVLCTALEAIAGWRKAGTFPDLRVSVNVSARQLDDRRLAQQVRAAIADAGLPANALALEITESTLMRDPDRIRTITAELCATGVGLQLDDFGTGYSSLSALHQLPVDTLKIDRSFIAALNDDSGSDPIVRSTIALAHSLGMQVIAEGIETTDQLRRLRTLGCEYGQGFLFSEPLDHARTSALLADWSPATMASLGDRAIPT